MILIEYSKLNGAEYIPHLDMLKHFAKIIRRMGVKVEYSQGFNPHMLVFMSSPIALGLKSKCEYCIIQSDENAELFKELFNKFAPSGIRCERAFNVTKKAKIASEITSATYVIYGINKFDVSSVLTANSFIIEDKHGNLKEVKEKILSLSFDGNDLIAKLAFGNDTLRPDYLASALIKKYGGSSVDIIKTGSSFLNDLDVADYLEKTQCL